MPGELTIFIFGVVAAAFLVGWYGARWRPKSARRRWRATKGLKGDRGEVAAFGRRQEAPLTDAADQLRVVMAAKFGKRRLLSRSEAWVFYAAERAIRAQNLGWRVMAQVSLGEVLSSSDAGAYGAINSKRVDVLLVSSGGDPIVAIEFQGSGHYQGTAAARDAVKKEALRRAGVGYIEVTSAHTSADLAREISRIASQLATGAMTGG
jgi:hypothetical protein